MTESPLLFFIVNGIFIQFREIEEFAERHVKGHSNLTMTVAIMRKFVLLLPLIYLMPTLVADKTMGVYTAEPVADVLAVTFTAVLFFFVFRKAMKKLEEKKLAQ